MKLQFKNITSYAAALVCGAGLLACTNLSELEDRVDSLDNRITVIENQISTLQDNINAIKALFEGQIFITEISTNDTEDEIYITMSDGNTYTITQGQIGNTPQIAVDDEGYWIVNYGDGYQRITTTVGDEELEVTSVPQFRVNNEGYWEISTDGGKSWETVTYTDGTTPVPAVGDGGDFFQDISYDEETGELSITLSDGNTYTFTVATDFVCQIVTDENPVQFSPGSKRTFDVTMRGVQTVYIVKPDGWNVSLEGEDAADPETEITATLTVEAPANTAAGVNTKISADSDNDIVLHAVAAASDRSIFAKMTVELSNVSMPDADITVDEVTESSITFTVTPNTDVTSWKYMLLPATAEAPDAADDFDERATTGNDPKLNLTTDANGDAIVQGTEYILYVLVIYEGESTSTNICKSETVKPEFSTWYAEYEAGNPITVAGKTYTASEITSIFSSITHITSETTDPVIASTGAYFVDSDVIIELTAAPTSGNEWNKVLLIGNDKGTRSRINMTNSSAVYVGGTDGEVAIMNIEFNFTGSGNYMFTSTQNNDGFDYWAFDNCKFINNQVGKSLISLSSSEGKIRFVNDFIMENCTFSGPEFERGTSGNPVRIFAATGGLLTDVTFDSVIFRNNTFYCPDGIINDLQLFMTANNANSNHVTVSKMTIENNTFVNITPRTTALVATYTISTLIMRNNIFWIEDMCNQNYLATRCTGTYPTGDICINNIGYAQTGTNNFTAIYAATGESNYWEGAENITKLTDDPFAGGTFKLETGTFIPNSTYSSYGAQQ